MHQHWLVFFGLLLRTAPAFAVAVIATVVILNDLIPYAVVHAEATAVVLLGGAD